METVCKLNQCNGCMVCQEVCAYSAIKLTDNISTYNAVIDSKKCVNCGACKQVCPNNQRNEHIFTKPVMWFQGWAKSEIRMLGSSGGVASAIIKEFLKEGYVCSCEFEKGTFCFSVIKNYEEFNRFSGSKYVKSDPTGVYKKIKNLLKDGKAVLFIGLPCQVAAVKNFIPVKLQEKLFLVDLICHGTPSPKILDLFLKQYNIDIKMVENIYFRDKNKFYLKENTHFIARFGVCDKYSIAFLNGLGYTENCYNCTFARLERVSDITLGDSWGSNLDTEEQKKGISLILCQNQKGKYLLDKAGINLFEVDIKSAIEKNHQLKQPTVKPKNLAAFFSMLQKGESFNNAVFKCLPYNCLKQDVKATLIKVGFFRGG